MTDDEYAAACKRCEIPYGPNWNQRYRDALAQNGLQLSGQPQQPRDIQAPYAIPGDPNDWPGGTYIVEAGAAI